jgi:hypothetical protein
VELLMTATALPAAIDRLRRNLTRVGAPVANHLKPGLSADTVQKRLRAAGFNAPPELVALWGSVNGSDLDAPESDVVPAIELFSLNGCFERLRRLRSTPLGVPELSSRYLPFAHSGHTLWVVDGMNARTKSPVLHFNPMSTELEYMTEVTDSITDLVRTWNAGFRAGVVVISEDYGIVDFPTDDDERVTVTPPGPWNCWF